MIPPMRTWSLVMARKNGYYWVKFPDEPWEISYHTNGEWSFMESDFQYVDSDPLFQRVEIDEKRIVRDG